MNKRTWLILGAIGFSIFLSFSLLAFFAGQINSNKAKSNPIPERESLIPANTIKMGPENDPNPPRSLSDEYEDPIPLPYPVNTRGAEDSPFILPDGNTLYVWFTPDANLEAAAQAVDQATGIYKFERTLESWSEAERLWLAGPDEAHLDGCAFFQDDRIWFCGIREGLAQMHWFTAQETPDGWSQPELVEFIPDDEIGELHISSDGSELYFHSYRTGGQGGMDVWLSRKVEGIWQEPENVAKVNSEYDEGWPALSADGSELWISRNFGLWRSKKIDGQWQTPELMFSPLAGEATIDDQGNVYFTHHYFVDDQKIEADIYVAYKK